MTPYFFITNRKQLGGIVHDEVAVFTAYTPMQRGNDASHPFEQEANFWYLTGIDAPDWWVIITGNKSWLVAPDVDAVHQVFDGSLSWEEAKRTSGVDEVISRSEGETLLKELSTKHQIVYTLQEDPNEVHYNFVPNPATDYMMKRLVGIFGEVKDCRVELARLRAIKQSEEIVVIRRAIALTTNVFSEVKSRISDFRYEYEIEAEFSYKFRRSGAKGHAYDPIVAGGEHACTLHYNANQSVLLSNSLVLIDIGASVGGYAADITRTYAIGTPTQRQIDVHRAVEMAHQQIIALLQPGLSVVAYHESVDRVMKTALKELGLLEDFSDNATYRKYFSHSVSHGLGIDVHDSLGRPSEFLPGMVLTVEPGIYIPEEGIGVRIEDDILITDKSHENLSSMLSTSL